MTYHVAAVWHGLIMLDLQKSNKLLICISKITDYYRLILNLTLESHFDYDTLE